VSSSHPGSVDCGLYVSCTLYDIQGTSLDWAGCTVPTVGGGNWAAIYISADDYSNIECDLGSYSNPVFVVAVNTSNVQNDWYGYQHMVRHEVSHALGLPDTSHTCWTESGIYSRLPLMNNGPCAGPQRNYYLTNSEAAAIVSRNR
jgi:hypothetical protein